MSPVKEGDSDSKARFRKGLRYGGAQHYIVTNAAYGYIVSDAAYGFPRHLDPLD